MQLDDCPDFVKARIQGIIQATGPARLVGWIDAAQPVLVVPLRTEWGVLAVPGMELYVGY